MSKALTKNTHWLPKTGSHSVRLNRSGDIGSAAPVGTKDAIYDDLIGRIKRSQAEMIEIDRRLPLVRGDDVRAPLMKRKFQLQAELKNLRGERHLQYFYRYADEFLAMSRAVLSDEVLKKLDAMVVARLGPPPRHWQRFLGENGFGICDTSTPEQTKR